MTAVERYRYRLQWMPHGHRGRGRTKNTSKKIWRRRCGQQDTRTAERRWEAKAQNRAEWRRVGVWPCSTGSATLVKLGE